MKIGILTCEHHNHTEKKFSGEHPKAAMIFWGRHVKTPDQNIFAEKNKNSKKKF